MATSPHPTERRHPSDANLGSRARATPERCTSLSGPHSQASAADPPRSAVVRLRRSTGIRNDGERGGEPTGKGCNGRQNSGQSVILRGPAQPLSERDGVAVRVSRRRTACSGTRKRDSQKRRSSPRHPAGGSGRPVPHGWPAVGADAGCPRRWRHRSPSRSYYGRTGPVSPAHRLPAPRPLSRPGSTQVAAQTGCGLIRLNWRACLCRTTPPACRCPVATVRRRACGWIRWVREAMTGRRPPRSSEH
jgi:hypothetical protein